MLSKILQGSEHESTRRKIRPFSSNRHEKVKTIDVEGEGGIRSVAFFLGGSHIVSGGVESKIRCWRVEDGEEVGTPIEARSTVCSIAVSPDGKWLVSGTNMGDVTMWDPENHDSELAVTLLGHAEWVRAVDVSPDASRIATGSYDRTACVWSLSPNTQLLGPLNHDWSLAAVKFSPDGRLLATATWCRASLRVYDTAEAERILVDFPIQVSSSENQSLAWVSDSKHLFALSRDGNVSYLDVSNGTTLSQWSIHSTNNPRCIALSFDCQHIAASAGSSVSFWDVTTRQQIGSVVEHSSLVASIAVSDKYDLAIGGGKQITLRNIHNILHPTCKENPRSHASTGDLHQSALVEQPS